jgi:GNAT superfamily N-acetyltransferase
MRGDQLSELAYRALWPFCRMVAQACEEGRLVELEGVIASVVPVTPDRSITNSVAYESAAALERAHDRLESAYADAGVRAWTVWVPEADQAARRLLADAGHELDGTPTAMARPLTGFECSPDPALDLDRNPSAGKIGRINDVAYGFDGDFSRAFARRPDELHLYAARVDGEAVSCVGTIHEGSDCGVFLVATEPAARGRGLARELMTVALIDARAAGCRTASLQSTAAGKPIYDRLGFQDFGAIEMWEWRN